VIAGGILRENPFYVPPDEMLEELRGRRRKDHCGLSARPDPVIPPHDAKRRYLNGR